MNDELRVVVVGAGVFGVTGALELRRRGHRVTILDPGPLPHPNASSTDISKVVRMDYGADDFYFDLMEEAMLGWDAWNREWDRPLYHETGVLWMTRRPMEPGGFEFECFSRLERRGHRPERIGPGALAARHPGWNAARYPDGYWNRRAGWVESGNVVARLVGAARAAGVELVEDRYHGLLESGSRVSGVRLAGGGRLEADFVLVAAGAWTPILLPWLEDVVWPIAQPVLHFGVERPAEWQPPRFPVWGADTSNTGWYGFPALDDGTLKVANHGVGRRIHPDEPRETTGQDEARFRSFLRDTFPALANAPLVEKRLCLYSDSWDGNFWIDHDPDRPGLVVASGGSGHGFKFAPALGGIIADVLEREPNRWAPRFAWRPRGTLATEDARNA